MDDGHMHRVRAWVRHGAVLALVEAVRRCVERRCSLVVCPAPDAWKTVATAAALLDTDLAGKSFLRRRAA
jgi:hypothetical protein